MNAQFGVFLPVASGGWIVSRNTPVLDGGWVQNRDAALIAEEEGLDFVMSMGKWRGFGGDTDHWGRSLESVTMMAGIAALTKRIKIWATLHAILHNPVVAAKIIATLDHVSGGRAGLNIVAGAYRGEFEQMNAWDEKLDHDARYDLTQEWLTIIKRLWREPRVDFAGRYFTIRDCVSEPKPLRQPDLICAGMSARGFDFSVREADACFIGGRDEDETRAASLRAKTLAQSLGKTIKTYAMCTVIYGDSDAAAEKTAEHYRQGLDEGAVLGMLESYGATFQGNDNAMVARARGAFMTHAVIGSPATCAEQIEHFMRDCALDGLMLVFADYAEGLRVAGREILATPPESSGMKEMLKDWIAPGRTVLLLIDMQVDFAAPDGGLGRDGMDMTVPQAAVAKAACLADAARAAGVTCVFVRLITHEEDETAFLREWKKRRNSNGPPLCRVGTRGAEFVGPRPQGGELVFSKKRYNAFAGTGLDPALRGMGVDTLVVAGLTTECCIDSSVRDAFERDYHVFVVRDATACYEPALHDAALRALKLNCAQIVTASDVSAAWNS